MQKIDLIKESESEIKDVKHMIGKMKVKLQANVDPNRGVDLHVPVSGMSNLSKLQLLINIHFNFYRGTK